MAGSKSEKITFVNSTGEKLAARLDRPVSRPRAWAVFAHCFTCSKDVFAASKIAQGLVQNDIAVLRFDFTGLGSSDGEFENTNFSSNVEDIVAACHCLEADYGPPDILIGHSLGGAAVLSAAKHVKAAKIVVTVNAPADPDHVKENFACSIPEIERHGIAEVTLANRPFTIKKQFLEDISAQNIERDVATMGKALLVFHAPMDQQVSVENAARIFAAAKHPKSFISLEGADHLLSNREDAILIADIMSAWVHRHMPVEQTAADNASEQAGLAG